MEACRKALKAEHDGKFGGRPIDPADPDHQRLTKALQGLQDTDSLADDLMAETRLAQFAQLLTSELERTGLPEEDLIKLRPMALRFGLVGETACSRMKLTNEALAIAKANDGYLGWKPHYVTVFQEEP